MVLENILPFGLDLTITITAMSAVSFFFGRLISDVKPQKYDKTVASIDGFVFFVFFILLPMSISLFRQENILQIGSIGQLLILWLVLILLNLILLAHLIVTRIGMLPDIEKALDEQYHLLENDKTTIGTLYQFSKNNPFLNIQKITKSLIFAFFTIPILFGKNILLFIYSIIISATLLAGPVLEPGAFNPLQLFIYALAFLCYTSIAFIFGYNGAVYPEVEISTTHGVVKGKVQKFDEYVFVLTEDKKVYLNKDYILRIDEPRPKIVTKNKKV